MESEMKEPSYGYPERHLAAAVLRQAMVDLRVGGAFARSAEHFLCHELLQDDDPWNRVLGPLLPARQVVLREVARARGAS